MLVCSDHCVLVKTKRVYCLRKKLRFGRYCSSYKDRQTATKVAKEGKKEEEEEI